jgi:hypothetical protein
MSVTRNSLAQMLGREVTINDVELMNWTMAEYAKKMTATDYAQAFNAFPPSRATVVGRRVGSACNSNYIATAFADWHD